MAIIDLHAKGRIYFVIERKTTQHITQQQRLQNPRVVFVLNFLTSFNLQLFGQHIN